MSPYSWVDDHPQYENITTVLTLATCNPLFVALRQPFLVDITDNLNDITNPKEWF